MLINVYGVKMALMRAYYRMGQYEEQIERLVGYKVNPKSHDDMQDLLINRFGLPAIYNEKKGVRSKGPSFDKNVLKQYQLIEDAPHELLDLIDKHRHESTMSSLFWETWLDINVDGVLHSDNNQCVRSGRLSCSQPNNQQVNNEARELVIPREGYAIACHDYKNIEYRDIIHYINSPRIVEIFRLDPDADFHQMMADEVGSSLGISINRKAAKILNLAMGYGMGKRKTIASLRVDPSIVAATGGDKVKAYEIAVKVHGEFHRRLPELKPHTRMAEHAARLKGYVKNAYGRRCHIPLQYARVAFNRVCQSHAADHMKDRANALDEERGRWGAHILALVHDETVSEVPVELAEQYAEEACDILNHSSVPMRVPIRCSRGVSDKSWLAAKEKA
jgi:DNA polymerase I-like protein with 3'-5' exonuclease and polymerase domains